ncbi:MAG: hypothetical protein IR158_12800 [Cellulomonas sp.]|uniref:hypothetical protein n=1 Tax=Cellulomonas sp. TaxID=40001 RepID=UPI001A0222EE|nr:hypothetical protein [Cellulomonas sp.]MBF0688627.1 hypothetical protein [Cellulomonas sp.]
MTTAAASDAQILDAEIVDARAVIAGQTVEAGGVFRWLEQRVATKQALSAAEALAWLDLADDGSTILKESSLKALAEITSVAPWKGGENPKVTILYSNGTAGGSASSLGEIDVDAVRIIDHSHVGKLLASTAFQDVVQRLAVASTDGSKAAVEAEVTACLPRASRPA